MTIQEQLARDEDCRLKPYKDSKGILTLGVGRNIEQVGISIEEAYYLLDNDIRRVKAQLTANFAWYKSLDEVRQGALINVCFNVGLPKFKTFVKMLAAIEKQDWAEAAKELLDSKYAEDVGARARRLAIQLTEGTWQ